MALEFSFGRRIDAGQLLRLYRQTGWAKERRLEDVRRMLANSGIVLGVWDGDRLIGFARAISDGVYKAMIDDVVVDEEMRGRGIGSEIVRRMVERLKDVQVVFLPCGERMVPFYQRFGFERTKTVYMHLKREEERR